MQTPVRLLIVDEEDLFREGLARLLLRDPDFRIVGQVRTGGEAIERANKSQPDLMLTAIALPDVNGIDLTRSLRKQYQNLRVAIVARMFTRTALVEGARAGVTGFITKDTTVDALTAALKTVARGEAYVPADVSSVLLEALAGVGSESDDEGVAIDRAKITDRERDVLQLLVEGATNRDISRLLSITENTVKVHLRNILDKLHLRNRQQAAAFAISSGLVTLPRSGEHGHRRNGRDMRHRPQRPNATLGSLRQ